MGSRWQMEKKHDPYYKKAKKEEAPAAPAPPPADIQLLTEIRGLLKDKK